MPFTRVLLELVLESNQNLGHHESPVWYHKWRWQPWPRDSTCFQWEQIFLGPPCPCIHKKSFFVICESKNHLDGAFNKLLLDQSIKIKKQILLILTRSEALQCCRSPRGSWQWSQRQWWSSSRGWRCRPRTFSSGRSSQTSEAAWC